MANYFLRALCIPLLYIFAIFICPVLAYRYRIGHLPSSFKYFDDFQADFVRRNNLKFNSFRVRTRMGQVNSLKLNEHNKTYLKRLNWLLIRHPLDYYKKVIINGRTKL